MADRFKQDPLQVLRTYPARLVKLLLAWMDVDLENPTPDQWFLIQIAAEVRRVLAKDRNSIQLDQFRLKFNKRKKGALVDTKRTAELAKAKVRSIAGPPAKVIRRKK